MRHKILIGFMGSGKSCVSALLAERTGWNLLDTDAQIEKEEGKTISRIFEEQGEAGFRQLESRLLVRLSEEKEPLIISTGGGMAAQPRNRELLSALGDVIYLQVQPETVLKRLSGDTTRPLLSGEDREQKVRTLLEKRVPVYEAAADYRIETDSKTPEEIVEEIMVITQEGR